MTQEKYLFNVIKGGLTPADQATVEKLREKGFKVGDTLAATLSKPRSPEYHRFAHQFGTLIRENIEGFENLNSHQVLKRLQIESGIGCDEMKIKVPGLGFTTIRLPQSLSFASMDESRFREVMEGLSRYVIESYWPNLTVDEINNMISGMP